MYLVSEGIPYAQINNYMENKLSKYVTSFHKSGGTQYFLMMMLNGKMY